MELIKIFRGEVTTLELPYDTGSVMHYESKAFSRNGKPTIISVSGKREKLGQRQGFSRYERN